MSTVVLEGGPFWLFILASLIELGVVILLTVIWCNSMERALRACDFSSRKMPLGQSWLIFVPLFGFIWQFVAVNRVSESLATEYHLRGWKSDEGRPGIETGLIACVVILIVFLVRTLIVLHPGISVMMSLGVCICMYMHRERLNAFTERLEAENKKAQLSFSFDSGPNPFNQSFSPQSGSWQSYGQQSHSQQSFSPQPFNQQVNQQPFAQPISQQSFSQQPFVQPNYNQQYPAQGFPQYNQPMNPYQPQNPFQPQQNIPPVQQYTQQQYVQQQAQQHQQQQQKKQEEQRPPGGWDGMTTWEAPEGWKHPDLSDPREYFS